MLFFNPLANQILSCISKLRDCCVLGKLQSYFWEFSDAFVLDILEHIHRYW